jgi:probable rRNA maturation factor
MGSGRRGAARLHVTVLAPDGSRRPAAGLGPWLAGLAPARARGEVTVALVSDGRMRTLNRTFRGVDRATDVLSFPTVATAPAGTRRPSGRTPVTTVSGAPAAWLEAAGAGALGDIVIAAGTAARQAAAAGHSLGTELRILALHGLLHLLGYDHDAADDAGAMARAEARLRRRGGLPAGLIERAGPGARRPADLRR